MPEPANTSDPLRNLLPLLTQARTGSRDALGQLLEPFRPFLLAIAQGELNSDLQAKAGASDLVQDTFLEAQRDFPQFHGHSAEEFQAWLRRILLNNLGNLVRRYRDTDKRQIAQEMSLDDSDNQGLQRGLMSSSTSPSGKAIKQEEAQGLERTLARLPEHYRQVLHWRHREYRSFEEIGQRLNCSPDAARMMWNRAVKALQEQLNPPAVE
jgi:RNA polymerase sigma-70 factor, ECF subfamily